MKKRNFILRIVVVSPKEKDVKRLEKLLKKAYCCKIITFNDPHKAYEYIQYNPIEALYTEIAMNGFLGTTLLEKTMEIQPLTRVIFLADSNDFLSEVFEYHAWYFLVSPFSFKEVCKSLDETVHYKNRKYTLKEKLIKLLKRTKA